MWKVMRFVALSALLGACGGKKDEPVPTADNAGAGPTTPPADRPAEPPADQPAVERLNPPAASAPADLSQGSCRVQGSGAVTFDQDSTTSLNVGQWHSPEMRAKLGYDETGFTINCQGKDIRLSILSSEGKGVYGANKYTVGGKGADAKVMGQIGEAKGRQDASIMQATGTLDITAFDDKHIAGTLDVTVKTLPDKGEIGLTATFDLPCKNHSGCK